MIRKREGGLLVGHNQDYFKDLNFPNIYTYRQIITIRSPSAMLRPSATIRREASRQLIGPEQFSYSLAHTPSSSLVLPIITRRSLTSLSTFLCLASSSHFFLIIQSLSDRYKSSVMVHSPASGCR